MTKPGLTCADLRRVSNVECSLRLLLLLWGCYKVVVRCLMAGMTAVLLSQDLRNFQYSLPMVEGLQVHMEMGNSYILIPKAKFTQMLKAVNSSNEHVISVGASFSREADSHLVCFQNEDGNYQTQANGMLGKTRT
ncbi:hypothetical protein SKAU_G00014580, partial [Synaphobranchus kaupii]